MSCRAIEIAIRTLDKPWNRDSSVSDPVEGVEGSKRARGRDFEHRTGAAVCAAVFGCAVETAVGSLHHRAGRISTIGAIERNERGQSAAGRYFENRAITKRAAFQCGAVKATVGRLKQVRDRPKAVVTVEAGERGERNAGELENGAQAIVAAFESHAIETAIFGQHQACIRSGAVQVGIEIDQVEPRTARCGPEQSAPAIDAAPGGRAVQKAIASLHQRAVRVPAISAVAESGERRQRHPRRGDLDQGQHSASAVGVAEGVCNPY